MEKEIPLYVTLMPIATALIAVLVTLLTLVIKERLDYGKKLFSAQSVLLMFLRSMQRNIAISPEFAKHVDIGMLSANLPEIAGVPELNTIYSNAEEVFLLWRQGAFKGRLPADPYLKKHAEVLNSAVEAVTNRVTKFKLLGKSQA